MQVVNHVEIRDGEAYLSGRNLKAKLVARMHLWVKRSVEEIMAHYNLSAAEVHAALAFYYDNRETLDAEYAAHMELLKDVGTSTEAFRAKIDARKRDRGG